MDAAETIDQWWVAGHGVIGCVGILVHRCYSARVLIMLRPWIILLYSQLTNQPLNQMAVYVGQSERTSGIGERQTLVVNAKLMQNRRLDVVNVNRIFDRVEAEFVCFADRLSGTNSAARHPHRERLRVMVTS